MIQSLPDSYIELPGTYATPLVLLSIIIAWASAYTALSMNGRSRQDGFFPPFIWQSLASLAMGFGIWSMHFVGMSAFSLPVHMSVDYMWTMLSIIPAVAGSYFSFYMINKVKYPSLPLLIAAALLMGSAISLMHYTGMEGMKSSTVVVYSLPLLLLSVFIAVLASFVALYLMRKQKDFTPARRLGIALILGLAVSAMHYTGMAAASFWVGPSVMHTDPMSHASIGVLGAPVAVGMFFLLLLLLFSGMMDQYIDYRISHFDRMTRLPNRQKFEADLQTMDVSLHLAVWHFHGLKKINQEFGYSFGDTLIQNLVVFLQDQLPRTMQLYRIEGNRFAVLSNEDGELFYNLMADLAKKLREPFPVRSQSVALSSACAFVSSAESHSADELYFCALSVLEHPLTTFDNHVITYDPAVHHLSFEQELIRRLPEAMRNNELFLVYQPKIDADTYRITGYEALLRWEHPERGMISPAVFVPFLERYNLIEDVTIWVINQTAAQLANWNQDGARRQIAVNVSGRSLSSPVLLQTLLNAVQTHDLDTDQIEIELTETSVVESTEKAVRAIALLRQNGFSVSLDDFGTGVSSLSFLRQLPISTVKIDRSFLFNVPESDKDSAVLQAIVSLGQSLDLAIVIEGVERQEHVDFLKETASGLQFQGYFFAKPLRASEVDGWLTAFHQKTAKKAPG